LDTYHAERHPVGARALRNTMAAVVLRREDERTKALRETLSDLLALDQPRRRLAATLSGLDIRYDLGHSDIDESHPLLGRRMRNLPLAPARVPLGVSALLHGGRPVLLNFDAPGAFDIAPGADRFQLVAAQSSARWELPALGGGGAPAAVLIRPDGYVA